MCLSTWGCSSLSLAEADPASSQGEPLHGEAPPPHHRSLGFQGGPLTVPGARCFWSPGQRDSPRLTGCVVHHSLVQRGQDPCFIAAGTDAEKKELTCPRSLPSYWLTETGWRHRLSEPLNQIPLL